MAISDESGALTNMEGKFKAMLVCFLLGLGSLFAENCMWTMGDYFYKVFPRYHPLRVFTIIYQPVALAVTMILTHYESRINTRKRNLSGYMLFFTCSLVVLVVDLATLGKGGIGPYIGLCALFACFGIAHAFVQGGMAGDLSSMCPEFIQSFIGGINASGVLASGMRLLTKATFEKFDHGLRKGALLSLAISAFFELLCIILYAIYFPKLSIVKYYRAKAASEGATTVSADTTTARIQNETNQQETAIGGATTVSADTTASEIQNETNQQETAIGGATTVSADTTASEIQNETNQQEATLEETTIVLADTIAAGIQNEANQQVSKVLSVANDREERLSNKQLFLQNIDYAADLFMIYMVTLSIMPGFLYEDTGSHQLGTWYPLVLVTTYNIMGFISSYIPLINCMKLESRKGLLVAAVSRFFLIPAFYFTAKYGDQGWMIMLVSLLGLTNSYLTVCVYTVVPKGYKGPEKNALGNMLALWLLSGVSAGGAFGWMWLIGKAKTF